MFSAAESQSSSSAGQEKDKKLQVLFELVDAPKSEEAHKDFVEVYQDEITEKLAVMRNYWDQGRKLYPTLTIDQFWEFYEKQTDHQFDSAGVSKKDPMDKFAISAVKLIDRTAWSFSKMQLMREAGVY